MLPPPAQSSPSLHSSLAKCLLLSWGRLPPLSKTQQDASQEPRPPLQCFPGWASGRVRHGLSHRPAASVSSPERGFPCHSEMKHKQRAGGEEVCLTAGDPSRFPFHHRSFIWIRVSSLLNPLFAVCYSTCTQRCAFIFISSNCFPVLMGSHYSHTIERKCSH